MIFAEFLEKSFKIDQYFQGFSFLLYGVVKDF